MGFFVMEPEAAGRPTSKPRSGSPVSCTFDTWLGDDFVRAHPHLLVTQRLKEALEDRRSFTGYAFAPAHVAPSPFYERHDPARPWPTWWSVEVHGRAGHDDVGLTRDGSVVVSARVVEVLSGFVVLRATLRQYAPALGEEYRSRTA